MRNISLLLLPLLLLLSCKQTVDPEKYNDQIIAYLGEANNHLVIIDTKLYDFFENDQFSAKELVQLNEEIQEAKDSIQSSLGKIKALEKAEGADNFRNTAITYVEAIIAQIDLYKEQYSTLSNDTSDEELIEMDEIVNIALVNTDNKFEDMQKAQTEFAKENNLNLFIIRTVSSSVLE